MRKLVITPMLLVLLMVACRREPELHLYEQASIGIDLPVIDLSLDVYWNYELFYDVEYDWETEWYYGWDEVDKEIFGELGYAEPTAFNLRRYFTGSTPLAPHTSVVSDYVAGRSFQGQYNWGYWDLLVWNDIVTLDGVQSLHFDEQSSLDEVTAYTTRVCSRRATRRRATRTRSTSRSRSSPHTRRPSTSTPTWRDSSMTPSAASTSAS